MQVILIEDVPHLGSMGDVVNVKPGYGRNYLIPRNLATLATKSSKRELEHELRVVAERRAKLKEAAMTTGNQLDGLSITIARRAGEDNRLFGSVTNRDLQAALADNGYEVERRRIMMNEPFKALGIYQIPVKLHADVTANVLVWICAL